MAGYDDNVAGSWICNCGKENTGKFCVKCGAPRPAAPTPVFSPAEWVCTCGVHNTGKFCIKCGTPRSNAETQAAQEVAARKAAQEEAACRAAEEQARQEAAARKAAQEEAAARQAAEEKARQEAAARKAAQEEAACRAAEEKAKQEAASVSSAEASGNNGMMKKAAIGVAVLLVLLGAYFMFGRKKEEPPAPEPAKVETKAETKAGTKSDTEKPADLSAQAEKLKEYAEMMKAANAEKKHDATTNEKIVFLVDEVKRNGNDLVVVGHFYNGKKNRTITSVKSVQLDIMLRDMDKELLNEKNIKYENAFTGMRIEPLKDSQSVSVDLPGKAPAAEFNNYVVSVHDVHWEAVGK